MAEIQENSGGGKKGHGKQRAKKHSTHIDMTPMVDLMSLLITFFMLTTAFSKPKVMEIVLPEKAPEEVNKDKGPQALDTRILNLLLGGNDSIYYYIGKPPMNDEDVKKISPNLMKSDYSKEGIRRVVLKMNMPLYERVDSATQKVVTGDLKISTDSLQSLVKEYKKYDNVGPIVMIKANEKAKYKNIVDVIDEMAICSVARYAFVDINIYEVKLLQTAGTTVQPVQNNP